MQNVTPWQSATDPRGSLHHALRNTELEGKYPQLHSLNSGLENTIDHSGFPMNQIDNFSLIFKYLYVRFHCLLNAIYLYLFICLFQPFLFDHVLNVNVLLMLYASVKHFASCLNGAEYIHLLCFQPLLGKPGCYQTHLMSSLQSSLVVIQRDKTTSPKRTSQITWHHFHPDNCSQRRLLREMSSVSDNDQEPPDKVSLMGGELNRGGAAVGE